ncbi:MAG TPA: DUF4229 domain-containing protein [Pseudonocardia sp.]|jgi:membrane protein implicated in regulation of membrane protease activity|nr:DUF4229 domain-containing protein [Pseudonocardia sp.]
MSRPDPSSGGPVPPVDRPAPGPSLPGLLALYAVARLGLVAVIAGLLVLAGVPVVVALLVALVVALPLSMVLFRGLRGRVESALAERGARRRAERDALRARLRGEDRSAEAAEGEPDRGGR